MYQEGIERLSAAIVSQAIKDCARDIRRGRNITQHLKFFNSQYCYMLSGLEPTHLYELAKKVANKKKKG